MNKRHYEHTLPNIRGSLSNTYNIIEELKRLPDDIPLFPSCRMWQEGNKGDF